jgi:hypothetical protein
LKVVEHSVLLLGGRELRRFPGTAQVVGQTRLQARIEKNEFRALSRSSLHQLTITSLDNPVGVRVEERAE